MGEKKNCIFFFLTKFAKLFDLERKFDFKSEEREEGNIEKYIIHPYIYMYIYIWDSKKCRTISAQLNSLIVVSRVRNTLVDLFFFLLIIVYTVVLLRYK